MYLGVNERNKYYTYNSMMNIQRKSLCESCHWRTTRCWMPETESFWEMKEGCTLMLDLHKIYTVFYQVWAYGVITALRSWCESQEKQYPHSLLYCEDSTDTLPRSGRWVKGGHSLNPRGDEGHTDHHQVQDVEVVAAEGAFVKEGPVGCHLQTQEGISKV